MHGRYLVVDAHSDMLNDVLPKRITGRKNVIAQDWLPGMKKGGIDVRVLAIYSDVSYLPELALRRALDLIAALYAEIDESPNLVLCTSYDDIKKAKQNGKIGFILSMEGAEPLGRDIQLLRVFHSLGLRVLGLTHNLRNYAGEPALTTPAETGQIGGLSDFGSALIQEANELGVVIDVSHLNDPGVWDVMRNSRHPVIASHSNCRALLDHPRGLTDEQIRAIAENGGVIGINACALLVGGGKDTTIDMLLDHLEHIVNVGGMQSVGLGLDFADYLVKYLSEEERTKLPYIGPVHGLSGDADVPKITQELFKRGYDDEGIELILGKNFMRVFQIVFE